MVLATSLRPGKIGPKLPQMAFKFCTKWGYEGIRRLAKKS